MSSFGGTMREIMDVPAPFAASNCLISRRIFHCSIAGSTSDSLCADPTFAAAPHML